MGQNQSGVKESQVNHGTYKSYKFEYKWTISNFINLATKYPVGTATTSQTLNFTVEDKSNTFNLVLYTHGYNERVKDYLSIWLKKFSAEERLIQFTCAVLDSNNKEINAKSIKKRLSIESSLGWATFCRRDFLLDSEKEMLNDGNLTLNCTMEIFENKAITNAEIEDEGPLMNKSLIEISKDMNQLLVEGDFSDISFKVFGNVFRAHKAVLSARSAVFKTMLKSPLQGDSNGIKITDISAETVKELLHYIYSGDVGRVDVEMAQELYYAADKYELHSLKEICYNILARNLDVNNVIDILLIGHKHSDNNLKYVSIEFIAKNAAEVQEKQAWIILMQSHPELVNKVFKYLSKKT